MITGLGPDGSVKASGIEIGDVVLKVDGEPVHDRMNASAAISRPRRLKPTRTWS